MMSGKGSCSNLLQGHRTGTRRKSWRECWKNAEGMRTELSDRSQITRLPNRYLYLGADLSRARLKATSDARRSIWDTVDTSNASLKQRIQVECDCFVKWTSQCS